VDEGRQDRDGRRGDRQARPRDPSGEWRHSR
jgi:hypothetical protein